MELPLLFNLWDVHNQRSLERTNIQWFVTRSFSLFCSLHQLSVWIVVAKHQSVTKTADELHIRQPTVSQQIKSLQKECGIKLYKAYRGKGIEITQAGRLLLKHAKKILLQVKTLESELKSSRRRRGGRR